MKARGRSGARGRSPRGGSCARGSRRGAHSADEGHRGGSGGDARRRRRDEGCEGGALCAPEGRALCAARSVGYGRFDRARSCASPDRPPAQDKSCGVCRPISTNHVRDWREIDRVCQLSTCFEIESDEIDRPGSTPIDARAFRRAGVSSPALSAPRAANEGEPISRAEVMSLAPDDGSADTDSKRLVRLKSVIRGVQTVGDGVKKTAGQKINDASGAMNSRDQRQAWMDLILSKEFDQMLDETFDKCSGINVAHDADDSLDANELAVAMEILYKRLDEMSGSQGKLPIIKESVSSILAKYDQDNNGVLDRREFRGFARTYFSRMEWPLWKTAARGAGKGVIAWVVTQTVVKPSVGKVFASSSR